MKTFSRKRIARRVSNNQNSSSFVTHVHRAASGGSGRTLRSGRARASRSVRRARSAGRLAARAVQRGKRELVCRRPFWRTRVTQSLWATRKASKNAFKLKLKVKIRIKSWYRNLNAYIFNSLCFALLHLLIEILCYVW